jgi:hypothetical protein
MTRQRRNAESRPTVLHTHLTAADVRGLVFADNADAQANFQRYFASDIRRAVGSITSAYNLYRKLELQVGTDKRIGTAVLFVHAACNSLITSLHFLVSGFPISAGNLMRQYAEAVAMALLCAVPETGVYQRYSASPKSYAVHKATDMLLRDKVSHRLKSSLGFNREGWRTIIALNDLYNRLSHTSSLALAHLFVLGPGGGLIIGSQFDVGKRREYRSEISRISSAAERLQDLVLALDQYFESAQEDRGPTV